MTSPDKPQCRYCDGSGVIVGRDGQKSICAHVSRAALDQGDGGQAGPMPDVSKKEQMPSDLGKTGNDLPITPPTSFAAEVREALELAQNRLAKRRDFQFGDLSVDEAVAAITAAYERDMEQFVRQFKDDMEYHYTEEDDFAAYKVEIEEQLDRQLEQRARIKGEGEL